MSKANYTVWMERKGAVLYLAWEFGIRDGYRRYRNAARDGIYVNVTDGAVFPITKKVNAVKFETHARCMANYQLGRLRQSAYGFLTKIERSAPCQ